jgi:endoglucanase
MERKRIMNTGRISRFAVLSVVLIANASSALQGEIAGEFKEAFELNKRLGRGVNIIGYDPLWRDRAKGRFSADHFKLIREAGFSHVRINLHPFRDGRPGNDHKLSEAYFRTLDWAVDQALSNQLMVILDFHEFMVMADDPVGMKDRFLAIWAQISDRCKNRPGDVLFEILNEPNGNLTPELWNQFLAEALAIIRRTNPTRTVIIGPGQWNNINQLPALKLPDEDRNIIATVHYYSPMSFTHQGAAWTGQRDKVGIVWNGTEAEKQAIAADFDKAQDWSRKQRRPVYLGEFGAYDKAEMASRVRYINCVAREAESHGWSWGYWQFDGDFIVYDIKAGRWIEPIKDALLPRVGN